MSELPYPQKDEKTGNVICQICGKPLLVISPTHLKTHGVSYEDYQIRFPTAPLSTEEFRKRGRIGKKLKHQKELFSDRVNPILEIQEVSDIEPDIEELDISKIIEVENTNKDPISSVKQNILKIIRKYFPNAVENYMIILRNPINDDIYKQYITDFADPVLKIDLEFPNAFWHNAEFYPDSMRQFYLESNGWQILTIESSGPTEQDIKRVVDEYRQKSKEIKNELKSST